MEQQRELIQEMGKEAQAGTTFTARSSTPTASLMVVYDSSSNQLCLHIQSGDYEWLSEWLDCENLWGTRDMERLIQVEAKLWPLRVGLHSRGRMTTLTPLELSTRTIAQFEYLLA